MMAQQEFLIRLVRTDQLSDQDWMILKRRAEKLINQIVASQGLVIVTEERLVTAEDLVDHHGIKRGEVSREAPRLRQVPPIDRGE